MAKKVVRFNKDYSDNPEKSVPVGRVKVLKIENFKDWDGEYPVFYEHWIQCECCPKEFYSRDSIKHGVGAFAKHAAEVHGVDFDSIHYSLIGGGGLFYGKGGEESLPVLCTNCGELLEPCSAPKTCSTPWVHAHCVSCFTVFPKRG